MVGIGVSAGGLEAVRQLLGRLPPDTGMAIVLVRHPASDHESSFSAVLAGATPMPVGLIAGEVTVLPDHVYVGAPGAQLELDGATLRLCPRPNGRRPSQPIDHFFRSLALARGELAIAVVLAGATSDGTLGLRAIKAEGGITFAQDPATARVDAMPRSAIAAGAVDLVLSPGDIGAELGRMAGPLGAVPFDAERAGRSSIAEELARRRTRLAIENARFYRTAREAIEARDEFLAVASHELKTPLSALILQLQSLQQTIATMTGVEERVGGKLERALRQTGRISKLIESLLDVSRITAGRLRLQTEETDLAELVRDVTTRLRGDAERAGCDLVVSADQAMTGYWDRLRIEQVIANLLSNALKYAPGKPVEIEVAGDERNARLTVRDHGAGIAPDQWTRIFERFERAVGMRAFAGLGLGLYFTRQIAEAHGGSVRVDSQPGQGCTFVVELPRRPSAAEAVPSTSPAGGDAGDGAGDLK